MMLIPNAIPAIPSDLILDVEQQRHTTTIEDNVAGRKGKSEILTSVVAPVLFTMGIWHVRPSKMHTLSGWSESGNLKQGFKATLRLSH